MCTLVCAAFAMHVLFLVWVSHMQMFALLWQV